jgi:preprotein translocase subunit SecA
MAQRDPLVEYQREGFAMFQAMMEGIREESVGFLFNLEVQPAEAAPAGQPVQAPGLEAPARPVQLEYSAPAEDGSTETHVEQARAARAGQNGGDGTRPQAGQSRSAAKGGPGRRSRRR